MRPVIVLAGTTMGSVLSICKSVHKYGADIFVICFNEKFYQYYKSSKLITEVFYMQTDKLLDFCENFIENSSFSSKPILYTTTDEQCLLIEISRSRYENLFELCMPSSNIIQGFTQKGFAEKYAEKQGALVPKSKVIDNVCIKNEILNDFLFPVIVKPISASLNVGYKFKILTKSDFKSIFQDDSSCNGDVICQEYIPGEDEDYKFYIFYRDEGGHLVECMGNKTKQTNGIMTIGTTQIDDTFSKLCSQFLKSIDYVGIGGLEFKKYKDEYYFIEMSTRPEGFLPIADMAGVSLSEASYRRMNGLEVDYTMSQKENTRYIVLLTLVIECFKKFKILSILRLLFKLSVTNNNKAVEFFLDTRCYWSSVKSHIYR